jgi:hypothetical protein
MLRHPQETMTLFLRQLPIHVLAVVSFMPGMRASVVCLYPPSSIAAPGLTFTHCRTELHVFDQPAILDMKWSVWSFGLPIELTGCHPPVVFQVSRQHGHRSTPCYRQCRGAYRLSAMAYYNREPQFNPPCRSTTSYLNTDSLGHTCTSAKLECGFKRRSMPIYRLVWTQE